MSDGLHPGVFCLIESETGIRLFVLSGVNRLVLIWGRHLLRLCFTLRRNGDVPNFPIRVTLLALITYMRRPV